MVDGGSDLAAVAEIDLVAVVGRRVVRGRHHDPGNTAELSNGKGQQGGGQWPWQEQRLEACAADDIGCVVCEDLGLVPGVVADDDGALAGGLPEVRSESGGRTDHNSAVHPVGSGGHLTTETGSAELEPSVEAVGQLSQCCHVASRLIEQEGHLRAGFVVRVLCDPCLGASTEVWRRWEFEGKGHDDASRPAGSSNGRRANWSVAKGPPT